MYGDASSGELRVLHHGGTWWGHAHVQVCCHFWPNWETSGHNVADRNQLSDWTIIQDSRWNRTGLNKIKFSDWPKFKFKFSLM